MGIINDLGLNESMTKEQVSEQLFNVRKKLITRQNSADIQKRSQAELQLDIVSSMQNAIDKMDDLFDVQVLVATYGFSADNDKLNKDLREAIEAAVSGNGDSAGRIADFVGNNGQEQLRDKWMFWAADCGAVNAYQVCGYLLTDTDPDKAITWFEKADKANVISGSNLYNWGLIYYRKKEFGKALAKFERASSAGHAMAPFFIGEIYEKGYGVTKDLRKALEQYQLAKQRGFQDAQQGITRVAAALNQQNAANSNANPQNNNPNTNTARQPQTGSPQNGQPTLVYKSDRKSAIPNLDDINIDNLKEKVKVDEMAGKVNDFANGVAGKVGDIAGGKVDTEKIKKLPWKKIIIGVVIFWIAMSLLKSCASAISSTSKKNQSNNNSAQVVEEVNDNDVQEDIQEDIQEESLADDTDATPISSFEYEVRDDGVKITKFVGSETEVIVPSVIEGKRVVYIASSVFKNNLGLTSITIKDGMREIGSEAFRGCSYLETVVLPDSLEVIGSNAFRDCQSISAISIPTGVYSIGDSAFRGDEYLSEVSFAGGTSEFEIGSNAFYECKSITLLELPTNVVQIGSGAFWACESLQSVNITGNNVVINSEAFEGCKSLQSLSINSAKSLGSEAFRSCISLTNLVLPDGLTSIGSNAFRDCSSLSTVVLPSSIQSVGDSAFRNNQMLSSVSFGSGTTDASIGSNAFYECKSINNIDLPGNYVSIGSGAFWGCTSLNSFVWGESSVAYANQSIGSEAFEGCSSLVTVTLTKNVESIGSEAFRSSTSLQKIDIPEGVTSIGSNAFRECTSLTEATIPGTIVSIGESAFRGDTSLSNILISEGKLEAKLQGNAFYGCTALASVTIPKNYVEIGSSAFYNCTALTTFVWDASGAVFENQSMGSSVFENCTSLNDAYISGNVGSIGSNAFKKCSNVTIHTASGSKVAQYAADNNISYITE